MPRGSPTASTTTTSGDRVSWVKAANVFLFQWYFVRLARVLNDEGKQEGWGFIGPVLPLSGWGTDYVGWPNLFVRWPRGVRLPRDSA